MTFNKLFFLLNTLLNDIQQPVYFFIILLCVLGVVLQTILDVYIYIISTYKCTDKIRGCRGRDLMVVRFSTTYAISAYHQ